MKHEEELIELLNKETNATAMGRDVCLLDEQRDAIEKTFRKFGLNGRIIRVGIAPQVNSYDFTVVKGERLVSYQKYKKDIEAAVETGDIRMVLPLPGRKECRLEIPNGKWADVAAGEVFLSRAWGKSHASLSLMLGRDVDGNITIMDLAKAPHLLVAGCTGTGKSIFMDSCLCSLMFKHTPDELKMILVDPKAVEFDRYKELPYLQFPVINSTKDTLAALQWLEMEMNRRFELLAEAGVRNINELNEHHHGSLPYIVMIIDELADSMLEARSQMELLLSRICARSRAVGIHLVIATQRPAPDVITENVKSNFPTRIAFRMASDIDSRQLIWSDDATDLLGRGDMLFHGPFSGELTRIQGCHVKESELSSIIERLKTMYGDMKPNPLPCLAGVRRFDVAMMIRDKLVDLVGNVLQDQLDFLEDSVIDDVTDKIADSIIEHLGELQETLEDDSDMEGGQGGDDEQGEQEKGVALSYEDRKLLLEAVKIVIEAERPTTSFIQRSLEVGYNKAAALLQAMERCGIVSPPTGGGERQILVGTYEEAVELLSPAHKAWKPLE